MGKILTISVLLFTFEPKLFAVVVSTNRICIKNYAGIENIVVGAILLCVWTDGEKCVVARILNTCLAGTIHTTVDL